MCVSQCMKALCNYFYQKFSTENFLSVSYFMDEYLDLEGSSDLGKFYAINMLYSTNSIDILIAYRHLRELSCQVQAIP